ncbi:MAG: phosphatase PAP2 family protein [Thermoanaerobaculia bacterium]
MLSGSAAPGGDTGAPAEHLHLARSRARFLDPSRSALLPFAALASLLALFQATNLDLRVQDLFFDHATGSWLVDAQAPLARWIFYTGPKYLLIIVACTLLLVVAGFRSIGRPLGLGRRGAIFLFLCLAVVPGIVSVGKSATGVWCPSQIHRYGGEMPYVKPWKGQAVGPEGRRGRCFPAGHASGGFALLGLFFLPEGPVSGRRGLLLGLSVGWMLGLYQMFKGAHYLSHTLVTMVLAWLIVVVLARLLSVSPCAHPAVR